MGSIRFYRDAVLACQVLLQLMIVSAEPQVQYYNTPNGQLKLMNGQSVCGECPANTVREATSGPYCGRCVIPNQSCATGTYMNRNGQCTTCPCPSASGDRRFGTSCRVDVDGQVTCDCPSEYAGRDCSQCAPGTIQNNQYPYNCLRPNNTNSFASTCLPASRCAVPSIPNIVQPRPICAVDPPTCNQTGLCPIGNNGCSTNGCNTQCPCPNPCGCPQNGCPGSCPGTQPTCPTPPPWKPPPPPPCPGPVKCPVQPPQCPQNDCPQQTACPINNSCPQQTNCPVIGPCPQIKCPVVPPCPQIQCPVPPTPPCQTCEKTTCPNPCPQQCPSCPQIPSCPDCRLTCPPCEQGPGCTNCPNPCQECPNPCQKCPDLYCPNCNVTCPKCPECPPIPITELLEVCICDPRGTAAVVGSQCICKVNVQGARCDQCKRGYFALSSTRPEGCLGCFCSGMTDSCLAVPYYRSTVITDRSANCTIELTDEQHTVVYSQGSPGFTFDGMQATFNKGGNKRMFWSLPSCMKGDRVTSYGGYLSFARMCSGGGNPLGADHEVMLVSGSEATVFWTTFEPQKCDGSWNHVDVLLAEPAYWTSFKGEQYRRATRGDIMEVLADLQLILIRATFTSSTSTTSIRNVSISSVTHRRSADNGIALQVESCSCPKGYRGLSCQNCAPGYYRDSSDVSKNIFGACKPCPCGKTAEGCHISGGQVICSCRRGFSGPTCQDKEVITINCDPFYIREMEGTDIDFTCSFTTNSKRRLLMKLGKEGVAEKAEDTTSITRTIRLEASLRRVACEIIDSAGVTWATVYCATEIIRDIIVAPPLPPRVIVVIPTETFICVNETDTVIFSCNVHSFGPRKVDIEWRKEGSPFVIGYGREMKIHNVAVTNAGTYICSATDDEVTGFGQIALMVRRMWLRIGQQYPINITNSPETYAKERHGGDFPNYPYQLDAPAVIGSDNSITASKNTAPVKRIDPVLPGHPKAVVDPSEVTAKIGSTVVLRCSASGEEPLKFYWKSDSTAYIPVHVRVSHGALIFRSLRSSDAGVYYCIAWNHLGQSTAKATIILDNSLGKSKENVTVAKNPLTVAILHPEITAKPGDNVNFQCRSNATDVMFHWSKVGEKMTNASEVHTDGLLTLYRVSEKEKGTYQCTVSTASGERVTAQAVLKLNKMGELTVPPRVSISPKSPLRIRTGAPVRLECESTGSPLPNATWVRSINGKEKKLVTSPSNKVVYEIKQMTTADVGKYACNAVSAAGSQSESMSLVIDDGQPCKDTEFRCKSGDQCIPREDRCDTEKDCRDGSDEANCKGSRRVRRHLKKKD